MALFNLQCSKCPKAKRVFADTFSQIPVNQRTCECGYVMHRAGIGPSTSVKERLDNGSMVKALERYSDAERIFQERHDNADPIAGTKPNKSA